jgi:hypothetical protein
MLEEINENDRSFLVSPLLLIEMHKQNERREECRKSGLESAKARNERSTNVQRTLNERSTNVDTNSQRKGNSSSPSPSSSSEDKISDYKNHSHPVEDAGAELLASQPEIQKKKKEKPPPSVMASEFMAVWNSNCGPLPRCQAMTNKRSTHVAARLGSKPLRDAELLTPADSAPIIQWLAADRFYSGGGERGWKADIDFLIRSDEQPLKFLELIQSGRRKPRDAFNGQLLNGPMDYSEPKKSQEEIAAIHAAAEAGDELPY